MREDREAAMGKSLEDTLISPCKFMLKDVKYRYVHIQVSVYVCVCVCVSICTKDVPFENYCN